MALAITEAAEVINPQVMVPKAVHLDNLKLPVPMIKMIKILKSINTLIRLFSREEQLGTKCIRYVKKLFNLNLLLYVSLLAL